MMAQQNSRTVTTDQMQSINTLSSDRTFEHTMHCFGLSNQTMVRMDFSVVDVTGDRSFRVYDFERRDGIHWSAQSNCLNGKHCSP